MRYLQRILHLMPILGFIATLSVSAFAETTTQTLSKKEPHKQTISFEDELVEGSTQKPELFYLFQKKNFNYKRLIKLRENFIPEAQRSIEDIQRGRGSN